MKRELSDLDTVLSMLTPETLDKLRGGLDSICDTISSLEASTSETEQRELGEVLKETVISVALSAVTSPERAFRKARDHVESSCPVLKSLVGRLVDRLAR